MGGSLAGKDSSEECCTASRSHWRMRFFENTGGKMRGLGAVELMLPVSINSLNLRRSWMMVFSGASPNIRAIIAPT